jgi:taurine--2-oxoglutarate transaminase
MYLNRSEGVFMFDDQGKRYLDFNAGAMCANLGHTVPKQIIDAVTHQLQTFPYSYPGVSVTDIRVKLAALLADMVPGDINTFMFPSTGMEANETALRIARMFTGRHKVLSRYRSYHGSSVATLSLTGDFRRFNGERGASSGHVHFMDPFPYSFKWGENNAEITERNLAYVREVVQMEGPHTIAAIFVESVTGTNGILPPPPGYLEGLRQICDQHGILLVCDEVMAGFGRTGRLFGWCHANVVPDITTAAKGITAAFLPLGMVGVRDHIAAHFRANPVTIGSTYNSHPVVLAAAYAALQYMLEHNIVQRVAKLEPYMRKRMDRLIDRHPSVKQARVLGLFGCFDVQKNTKGDFYLQVHEPLAGPMAQFKSALYEHGLFTFVRGHNVFTNPPLIVSEKEIDLGFDIFEKCLPILDKAMEKN